MNQNAAENYFARNAPKALKQRIAASAIKSKNFGKTVL